jgi:hypothetical protein
MHVAHHVSPAYDAEMGEFGRDFEPKPSNSLLTVVLNKIAIVVHDPSFVQTLHARAPGSAACHLDIRAQHALAKLSTGTMRFAPVLRR